jgi:hypothetical protein
MTFNVELAQDVLGHIELHPETWDQKWWASKRPACETSHCFAGWAVVIAEKATDNDFHWEPRFQWEMTNDVIDGRRRLVANRVTVNGESESQPISYVAQNLLGLSNINSHVLFSYKNTLNDLRNMIKFMIEHPGQDMGCYDETSWRTGDIVLTYTDELDDFIVVDAELAAMMEADDRAIVS